MKKEPGDTAIENFSRALSPGHAKQKPIHRKKNNATIHDKLFLLFLGVKNEMRRNLQMKKSASGYPEINEQKVEDTKIAQQNYTESQKKYRIHRFLLKI